MVEEIKDDIIAKANEAAARLEAANKKHEELIAREEALKVSNLFGGESRAGSPTKTQEEEDDEGAERLIAGTGLKFK